MAKIKNRILIILALVMLCAVGLFAQIGRAHV